jgi:hypothetical protein
VSIASIEQHRRCIRYLKQELVSTGYIARETEKARTGGAAYVGCKTYLMEFASTSLPPQKSDAVLIKPLLNGLIDALMAQKLAIAQRNLKGLEQQQQYLQTMWSRLQRVNPALMQVFPVECHSIQRLAQESFDLLSQEYQRVSTVLNAVTCNTYQASGHAQVLEVQSQDCHA